MRRLLLGFLAVMPLTLGCSANMPATAPASGKQSVELEAHALKGDLVYFVGDSRLDGEGMLEGVEVWMVNNSGQVHQLGKTDGGGAIRLRKAELAEGVVVGFSREWYFDGAWRVDLKELRDFDELFITLAPFSLR